LDERREKGGCAIKHKHGPIPATGTTRA
jgi:hypothetical protein